MTAANERRDLRDFDRIELNHSGELHITQGDDFALHVEGDSEVVQRLKSEVRGNTLHLDVAGDWIDRIMRGFLSFGKERVKYRVTLPTLRALKLTGYGNVVIPTLAADQLEITLSGYGNIELGELRADSFRLTISGRGELAGKGKADNVSVFVSGSGDVKAEGLEGRHANVRISGHGNVAVWATQSLDVSVSGYGRVSYRGDPTVSQTISGGGRVAKLDV